MSQTAEPIADQPPQQPGGTPPRRPRSSVPNLLRALLAVLALVVLMWLLVPRATSVPRAQVDLPAAGRAARAEMGFDPAVPVPPGWTVTSADVRHDTGELQTWTVNYLTPQGRYVGLMQTPGWTQQWQTSLTQGGVEQGTERIGGLHWRVLVKQEKEITTLMLREQVRTTLVLAKSGGVADARVLAAMIPPAP